MNKRQTTAAKQKLPSTQVRDERLANTNDQPSKSQPGPQQAEDGSGGPISAEDIRLNAYYKWEAAGKPEGEDVRFWLEAESECGAKHNG